MILRITDNSGDKSANTEVDLDLAQEFFTEALERKMWGKGLKEGSKPEFIPCGGDFWELVKKYDEVIMLPRQIGG